MYYICVTYGLRTTGLASLHGPSTFLTGCLTLTLTPSPPLSLAEEQLLPLHESSAPLCPGRAGAAPPSQGLVRMRDRWRGDGDAASGGGGGTCGSWGATRARPTSQDSERRWPGGMHRWKL